MCKMDNVRSAAVPNCMMLFALCEHLKLHLFTKIEDLNV